MNKKPRQVRIRARRDEWLKNYQALAQLSYQEIYKSPLKEKELVFLTSIIQHQSDIDTF